MIALSAVDASCGKADGQASVVATGGTSPYTYLWNTGSTLSQISNLATQTYAVTVTDTDNTSVTDTITVGQPLPPVSVALVANQNCTELGTIEMQLPLYGDPPFNYSLGGGDFQSSPTYEELESGTYSIKIVDNKNCEYTLDSIILKDVCGPISPAQGFSPNADGINDIWRIGLIENYRDSKVTVYDRWGQRVFHSRDYKYPWNGTNLGFPVPDGTYYYVIEPGENDRKAKTLTGFVVVVR